MGEFGLNLHQSGGSICSGVMKRGLEQSDKKAEEVKGVSKRHETCGMEVDDIQCKFPRLTNGNGSTKIGHCQKMGEQYQDEEEEGENKRGTANAAVRGGGLDLGGGVGRLYGWPSSRIVRVSRASGGKDRHSKVLTSKGLRDRRVRLSVNTAIQFYDLQDRLRYDQPSKAVEWLLKAAASSIAELPPMSNPFPDTPRQLSDEKRSSTAGSTDQLGFDSAEVDMDGGGGDPNYSQHQVTNPSACSSNSETSKGSGLSLSRSESRIKARERAKERVAEKEKEKESEPSHGASMNPISQTTSFTELLSAGINNVNTSHHNTTTSPNGSLHRNPTNESIFFQKSPRHWSSSTPMDYFTPGLLGPPGTRPGQIHLANPLTSVASPLFSVSGDHHPELQHFSFVPEQLVPVVNAAAAGGNSNHSNNNNNNQHHNGGSEYNLNFTISSNPSGLAGYNRGTLQSNASPSPILPHLQRLPPMVDGSAQSFFIGTAAAAPVENHHHQFLSGYHDSRLQLCYGDGHANNNNGRHSGHKGKGKN
ncbi:hypothetical protein BUALT_Bualt03G0023600 [Buddleja alternifolia]|uniref:Transcription factor TCP2-like n=1 Tax=Buddleja alternifolia TaxID=168488 RepID=A0AAV6XXD8_9LAMI|nr:hypothetical protein BUALT_Bualt03G0023600 [Buddleja alternifolia]